MQNECLHILFFYNPNKFFLYRNSRNLFNCKCNSFDVKLTNVDFVVTLGPEAEHLMINLVCKLVSLSIRFEIRISSHSLMLNQ